MEEEEKKEIQLQVQKSAEILEKFINESEEYVTNVRVANDAREVDRRDNEGIGREKVIEQLENEAVAAQNMFEEIANKWLDIQTYNDPLHINDEISNQKEKCDLVIKQKDEVIAMLRDELKKAERNFTKDQAKQMEDINTLAQRIERQVTFMRHAYQKEFELIEEVIMSERRILIDANNKNWDDLYKKRDQNEEANSDEKFEQLQDFYDTQTKMRLDFQEKFRETKIKLANDIENLQKELEKIKALALLNSEKLDYNYQILKKREDENIIIKSQQKRKINKLQDLINDLRHKISDYETTSNNRVKKLTDNIAKLHYNILQELEKIKALTLLNSKKLDYNYQILKKREDENIIIKSQQKRNIIKLQDLINDLRHKISDYETTSSSRVKKLTDNIEKLHYNILQVEEKADHFAKINDEKFHQVWEINRDHCEAILKKILETDKILHEQQMGITWASPTHKIIRKSALPSFKTAMSICTADTKDSQSGISLASSTTGKKRTELPEIVIEPVKIHKKDLKGLRSTTVYKRLLKYILKLVSDKSGFLTEKRLKSLIKYFEDDQKTLVRVDNVFESLGIHQREDIDILISYFVPYAYCSKCQGPDNLLMAQPSLLSRYTSQLSQLSSAFSRTDNENIDVVELEQAFSAVHQPACVIDEIVLDLVASEEYFEELKDTIPSESTCGEPLTEQYTAEVREKKIAAKKAVISDERALCQYNHPLVISSVYILRALREFVTAFYAEKDGLPTTGERLERKRRTVSRVLLEIDIENYWERFKAVYNEDRIRIWDALFEGLRKYHEILKDRKNLCEEVVHLRKQNRDLKRLLSNYINHGEHLGPPCAKEHKYLKSTVPHYTNAKM